MGTREAIMGTVLRGKKSLSVFCLGETCDDLFRAGRKVNRQHCSSHGDAPVMLGDEPSQKPEGAKAVAGDATGRLLLCLALILSTLVAGCAASTMTFRRMKPAEVNISGYRKVALGRFWGVGSDEFAADLAEALFASGQFEVLDRRNLDQVIREQNLSVSDSFDYNSAAQLGKLIGSAALITGTITTRDYRQSWSKEKNTCERDNGREYTCYEYTLHGKWRLNVNLTATDTSTGRVIATRSMKETRSRSNTELAQRPVPSWDREEVFDEMEEAIVARFMKMVTPSTVLVDVKFFTAKELPQLDRAMNLSKTGDWAGAVELCRTACEEADRNPEIPLNVRARAHYDLAVSLAYSGIDYDEALQELRTAIRIMPQDVFQREIVKVKAFKRDAEKLREQGIPPRRSSTRF